MAVKTSTKKPAAKPAPKASTTKKAATSTNGKAAPKKQWVFLFNDEKGVSKVAKTWSELRELLGGKGAGLFDMTRAGLPVPPGFTISTEACNAFVEAGNKIPDEIWQQTLAAMKALEKQTGKVFGGGAKGKRPLLVSVRSGARESMPGMMETVLNVGLNDKTVEEMAAVTGNPRFAWDSYRRLLMMFGSTVLGIADEKFDEPMEHMKRERGYATDTDLTTEDLKELVDIYKRVIKEETGRDFPQDVYQQLKECAMAVFRSATGHKARTYAKQMGWKSTLPTAVNVVTMIFGNMGEDSATGVAFTRDPSTGEKRMLGEYLVNAQGEDVVAGIRTPKPIEEMAKEMPKTYKEFMKIAALLEKHYRDMQDVEFTIEQGKLYMLQTRNGKRTARAAIKIAVDMAREKLITKEDAVRRVKTADVDFLLHPQFDEGAVKAALEEGRFLAKGVNASPGAAVGMLAFDADTAERWGNEGRDVILIRPETKPDDVHGMVAAKGILTARGGATSHAAVVARQFGIPAVVGADALQIDLVNRTVTANGHILREGDWVSLDGGKGETYVGQLPTVNPSLEEQGDLVTLLQWADEISARKTRVGADGKPMRGLQVWANADYPKDAERARAYGAQGIGLCRTEHMFFETERLPIVQRMILAKTPEEQQQALDELLPFQRSDFEGLFRAMTGLPVIIRLIDPPLHEFLPSMEELIRDVTRLETKRQYEALSEAEQAELEHKRTLLEAVRQMHEQNPMMGLRGIRLGIHIPGLIAMQVRAIFEAACNVKKEGYEPVPEVMIPLTGHVNELKRVQPELERVAKEVMEANGVKLKYKFGTMIEIPRAAITADEIAEMAEFFSFGTNDLTQMTFGYSRDDAERSFLLKYVEEGILPFNPFQTIDRSGVGEMMRIAVEKGRKTRPNLEVGICGEHGGDPDTIEFCYLIGQNYVSCSPFRVPVARLAAAHAALKHGVEQK
ncbi:MAG: pyruvate, phosphate dikinase [Anaerolineae bacterium]|nr:pyruvate, phosphate dikinase [Thermoflexales bacterium]MDW8395435.1 pyruvate, phosphate dikinase [Anaerolineae bacterium]